MTGAAVDRIIQDLFVQEALLIGGLVAFYQPDDEFVWKLTQNLNVLRQRFARRVRRTHQPGRSSSPMRPNLKPHPAIQQFLRELRRQQKPTGLQPRRGASR